MFFFSKENGLKNEENNFYCVLSLKTLLSMSVNVFINLVTRKFVCMLLPLVKFSFKLVIGLTLMYFLLMQGIQHTSVCSCSRNPILPAVYMIYTADEVILYPAKALDRFHRSRALPEPAQEKASTETKDRQLIFSVNGKRQL